MREFARRHAWLRGYSANYLPGLRGWLRRHTGLQLLQGSDQPQYLLAGYHPCDSITWIWSLLWWPPVKVSWTFKWSSYRHNCGWRAQLIFPLAGIFHFSTQRRMPWRKGAFTNGEVLH